MTLREKKSVGDRGTDAKQSFRIVRLGSRRYIILKVERGAVRIGSLTC